VNDAQVVRLRAEKLVAGGDALARLEDGRVAFVEGAIPGELVDARVLQSKTSFVRAEADSIIEPSSARVVPDCVHHKPNTTSKLMLLLTLCCGLPSCPNQA
jgi:tRNA/tmRNA/rRNA uracil-C5-methylase (TrmA/RlmC/RlmD family)